MAATTTKEDSSGNNRQQQQQQQKTAVAMATTNGPTKQGTIKSQTIRPIPKQIAMDGSFQGPNN